MSTLQQQIAEKFLVKLAESKNVHTETVDQLRTLLASGKKLIPCRACSIQTGCFLSFVFIRIFHFW